MSEYERQRFLLRMYATYWSNVSRAEDSAWKVFASYTALFAGLSLAYPIIGIEGFVVLFMLFSFVSIALALRANLWYVRNLGLISNIEREFLKKEDYGITVPRFFLEKANFFNKEIWWIHVFTYCVICTGVILLLYPQIKLVTHRWIICIILIVCVTLCIYYGCMWHSDYKEFRQQAPGKHFEVKK